MVGIIFPAESDLVVLEGDEAMVGDGHAMGVAGQIAEHVRGTAERGFGVDDPVLSEQGTQKSAEGFSFCEGCREPGNRSWPGWNRRLRPATNLPRKRRLRTPTGRKKG
jgi:hypothetical protein